MSLQKFYNEKTENKSGLLSFLVEEHAFHVIHGALWGVHFGGEVSQSIFWLFDAILFCRNLNLPKV